jgi:hypothetical protein
VAQETWHCKWRKRLAIYCCLRGTNRVNEDGSGVDGCCRDNGGQWWWWSWKEPRILGEKSVTEFEKSKVYWPVDFLVNPLLSLLCTVLLFCGARLIELCTVLLFWWGWKTLLTTTLTYVQTYFYFSVKFIILYSRNCPLKISRIKKFTYTSCKYVDTFVCLSLPSITFRRHCGFSTMVA